MIPLKDRVCFQAMVNRIPSNDGGGHPRCIGEECVNYEVCLMSINDAIYSLKKLEGKPAPLAKIRREYE
jgi:hypothetical protein